MVLVLDDLHWADQPSLLLLQFVARELGNSRLMVIGTYRDVELSRPMSAPTAAGMMAFSVTITLPTVAPIPT